MQNCWNLDVKIIPPRTLRFWHCNFSVRNWYPPKTIKEQFWLVLHLWYWITNGMTEWPIYDDKIGNSKILSHGNYCMNSVWLISPLIYPSSFTNSSTTHMTKRLKWIAKQNSTLFLKFVLAYFNFVILGNIWDMECWRAHDKKLERILILQSASSNMLFINNFLLEQ